MEDDPLAGWLAEEDDADDSAGTIRARISSPVRSGRLRRLLLLATVPWAVVVLLMVGSRLLSTGEASEAAGEVAAPSERPSPRTKPAVPARAGAPAPQSAPSAPSRSASEAAASAEASRPAATPQRGEGDAPTASEAAAAALAVRAARTDTVANTDGQASDGSVTYVDHAVAESAVALPDGIRLVSVLAVLLEGDGRSWRTTRTVRYAVPLMVTPKGPALAGAVYALPIEETSPKALPDLWKRVRAGGRRPAVVAALRAAGYTIQSAVRLKRRRDAPLLRADFRGTGPNESHPHAQRVWLRDGARPHVASP